MQRAHNENAEHGSGGEHGHDNGHGHAAPIVYTVTGTLSGTLTDAAHGSVNFTDAVFRWRVVGDTTNIHPVLGLAPVPVFEVPARLDTLRINDMTLKPAIPTVFAAATVPAPDPFGIGGFSDVTTNQGLAWRSPALAGYTGGSPVADLAVAFDNAGPLPTNRGELNITSATDLHFSAVVAGRHGVA
jgi:hypothetical protein